MSVLLINGEALLQLYNTTLNLLWLDHYRTALVKCESDNKAIK